MPKAAKAKRNGAAKDTPYEAKAPAANAIFKMNTDLGQHVLKNPGIADQIVNKADLKQSDVRVQDSACSGSPANIQGRSCWRSALVLAT